MGLLGTRQNLVGVIREADASLRIYLAEEIGKCNAVIVNNDNRQDVALAQERVEAFREVQDKLFDMGLITQKHGC